MNAYEEYYEKLVKKSGHNEYTIDGPVNRSEWQRADPRVLFLLKENYGFEGCGNQTLSDIARDSLKENNRTYTKCVTLVAALSTALEQRRLLSPDDIKSLSENRSLLVETLERIAVVNIKKASGTRTSDKMEIYGESKRNKDLLKWQITQLTPTIIVAGGEVCWDCLVYELDLFKEAQNCQKFDAVVCKNTVLCYSNHPAAWRGRGFNIHALHVAILTAYNSTKLIR